MFSLHREQIASDVKTLDAPPLLVGILANDDVASIRYANMCGKWCEEVGVKFELRKGEVCRPPAAIAQDDQNSVGFFFLKC